MINPNEAPEGYIAVLQKFHSEKPPCACEGCCFWDGKDQYECDGMPIHCCSYARNDGETVVFDKDSAL